MTLSHDTRPEPDGLDLPLEGLLTMSDRPHGNGKTGDADLSIDYQDLLERIPAVTYIAGFGETGRWVYVSPQIEYLLGFTQIEWLAEPELWFKQIHPEDRGRALEEEASSKVSGQPLRCEYRMLRRDGSVLWVRDEAILVRDEARQPQYWQGFMLDISARRQAETALVDSEARYRGLFERIPVGLYRTTPSGNLEDGNRALANILGYPSREDLLSADAREFYVDPSERERWKAVVDSGGVVNDFELQLRRLDGSVIWVRDSARVVRDPDGDPAGYEGVLQDISKQKQAEWEARQANQQLSGWVNELERRNREMTQIAQMAEMLQSCPTPGEAYTVVAHWAEQLFSGRAGALCVIAPSRNGVEPVAIWGNPLLGESVFAPEECWALRTGRMHEVTDPRSRLACRHLSEPLEGPALCVPMMAQGEGLGILHLQERRGIGALEQDWTAESLRRLVLAVAEHLALALANLRLRETLRTQSIRDPLTGLFNRRYMEESLERELRRADRRGHSVGVLMLDLDHFNQFNNTFGHQAGDALLQAFGDLLRANVRVEDIACRYGGEEFTCILPEASLDVAADRARLLVDETRRLRVHLRGEPLGPITTSAGVAVFPDHGRTAEALVHAADRALYAAKAEGRDRAEVAELGPRRVVQPS